jgi:preflagellin peptidase FlaK
MALNAGELLPLFNTAAIFVTLTYASYRDLMDRLVDDWVWLTCASVTTPVTVYQLLVGKLDPLLTALSIIITSILSYIFYRAGLYGGADAKGVIVVALTLPIAYTGLRYHPFAPISILLNALILSLAVPLAMSVINFYRIVVRREDLFSDFRAEKTYRKIAAVFLGTVIKSPRKHRFWAPMEEYRDGWTFRFSPDIEDFWKPLRAEGWATPSIPLLVFITVGAIVDYAVGDLSALILRALST